MRHLVFGLVMALLLSSSSALASQSSTMAFVTDSASNALLPINLTSVQPSVPISVGAAPFGVAVLPDGSRVYVSNRGFSTRLNSTVSVIAVADGSVKTTITVGRMPMGVAADSQGRYVYVANNLSHSLTVIATATDTVFTTVPLNNPDGTGSFSPRGVAVNPNPGMPYVYVTNRSSDDLAIVNTTDWSVERVGGIGTDPYGVAVAKDGKTVYVALEGDGKLALVDAVSHQVAKIDVGPAGLNSGPTGVAVGRDGKVYVTNTESANLWVVDPANVDPAKRSVPVYVGGKPVGVSVSPDGSHVYVANSTGASLFVLSTASNQVSTISLPGSNPIAFGIFVLGPTAIAVAIDIKPGSNQKTINLGSHGVTSVAILSTSTFSAPALVNPATVTLAGAPVQLKGDGVTAVIEERDVNGDGFVDLVVHVQTDAMVVPQGETAVVLEGKTWTGDDIRGEGTVRIVPGR